MQFFFIIFSFIYNKLLQILIQISSSIKEMYTNEKQLSVFHITKYTINKYLLVFCVGVFKCICECQHICYCCCCFKEYKKNVFVCNFERRCVTFVYSFMLLHCFVYFLMFVTFLFFLFSYIQLSVSVMVIVYQK